jgi:hypothetical protein
MGVLELDRATPNDLRRTTASWLAQANVPLELARRIMGHKGETMLRKVYARMHATQLGGLIEANILHAAIGTKASQAPSFEACESPPSEHAIQLVSCGSPSRGRTGTPSLETDFKAVCARDFKHLETTGDQQNAVKRYRGTARASTDPSQSRVLVQADKYLLAAVAARLLMRAA